MILTCNCTIVFSSLAVPYPALTVVFPRIHVLAAYSNHVDCLSWRVGVGSRGLASSGSRRLIGRGAEEEEQYVGAPGSPGSVMGPCGGEGTLLHPY